MTHENKNEAMFTAILLELGPPQQKETNVWQDGYVTRFINLRDAMVGSWTAQPKGTLWQDYMWWYERQVARCSP